MQSQSMRASEMQLQAGPRIWHSEAMDSCIGLTRQSLAAFTTNHPRATSWRPRASQSAARLGSRSLPSIAKASSLGLGLTGRSTGTSRAAHVPPVNLGVRLFAKKQVSPLPKVMFRSIALKAKLLIKRLQTTKHKWAARLSMSNAKLSSLCIKIEGTVWSRPVLRQSGWHLRPSNRCKMH
jgi:hypothetical protein